MRSRWNFFSVGPVGKTGFSSLGTAKWGGEVPLSDLMAILSAPQAPVQATSCALSRRSAPADPWGGGIASHKPQKFTFPLNDSADANFSMGSQSAFNGKIVVVKAQGLQQVSSGQRVRRLQCLPSAGGALRVRYCLASSLGLIFLPASFLKQF